MTSRVLKSIDNFLSQGDTDLISDNSSRPSFTDSPKTPVNCARSICYHLNTIVGDNRSLFKDNKFSLSILISHTSTGVSVKSHLITRYRRTEIS